MRRASITIVVALLVWGSPGVAAASMDPEPIMKGPKTHNSPISLYQGRHYVPRHNHIRLCIRHRESRSDYRAVSRTGEYRGAYQMTPALGVGAGWMIQKELRRTGTPKREALYIGRQLRAYPINQWHPHYQDMAFWLIWDNGKGAFHWKATVPGTDCGPGYHR